MRWKCITVYTCDSNPKWVCLLIAPFVCNRDTSSGSLRFRQIVNELPRNVLYQKMYLTKFANFHTTIWWMFPHPFDGWNMLLLLFVFWYKNRQLLYELMSIPQCQWNDHHCYVNMNPSPIGWHLCKSDESEDLPSWQYPEGRNNLVSTNQVDAKHPLTTYFEVEAVMLVTSIEYAGVYCNDLRRNLPSTTMSAVELKCPKRKGILKLIHMFPEKFRDFFKRV